MKTPSPNLDFWDEPLLASPQRHAPRSGTAGRLALLLQTAAAPRRLRLWLRSQGLAARGLRRSGKRRFDRRRH